MERVGVAAFEGVRSFEGVTERVTDRVGLAALEGTTACAGETGLEVAALSSAFLARRGALPPKGLRGTAARVWCNGQAISWLRITSRMELALTASS